MFISSAEKQRIIDSIARLQNCFDALDSCVEDLDAKVQFLTSRVKTLEKASHGIKKDGTPRAKPGRKTA